MVLVAWVSFSYGVVAMGADSATVLCLREARRSLLPSLLEAV
jgi:hypothetical protein